MDLIIGTERETKRSRTNADKLQKGARRANMLVQPSLAAALAFYTVNAFK